MLTVDVEDVTALQAVSLAFGNKACAIPPTLYEYKRTNTTPAKQFTHETAKA